MDISEKLNAIHESVGLVVKDQEELKTFRKQAEERLSSFEEWRKNYAPRAVSLPGADEGKDGNKFSLCLALLGISTGWRAAELQKGENKERADFTRDVMEQATKRVMEAGTDTKGGYAVPAQFLAQFIEALRPMSVIMRMGATQLTGLVGAPVEIPKETGVPTIAEYAESAEISFSDASLGMVTLTPKMLAGGVKFSRRLLGMAIPAVEARIRARLASELALKLDLNALRGTGAGNQQLGIVNWPGINSTPLGNDGDDISYEALVDMEGALEDDNALEREASGYGFVFHSKIRRKLAKLVDGDDRPLFNWDPTLATKVRALIGWKYAVCNQLPTDLTKGNGTALSEVLFGYWPDLLVGSWGNLILEATDQGAGTFEKHQVAVKVVQDVDTAVARAESFCLAPDVKTA